jgi:hypothetical protein
MSYSLTASFLAVVLLIAVGSSATRPPVGSSYVALSTSLDCTGTTNITIYAPGGGPVYVVANDTASRFSVDVAHQQYAFSIGIGGIQYVFANGTYEVVPSRTTGLPTCYYFEAYTFATEPIAKSTAFLVPLAEESLEDELEGVDVYEGLVGDAGIGTSDAQMAIHVEQDRRTGFPRLIDSFQKFPKLRSTNTCEGQPGYSPAQTRARISLTSCTAGAPDASVFQLPAICLVPGVPSWTDTFCF